MATTQTTDEILANLLADLATQVRAGGVPNIEALARQHPDLADELRSLWPAVMIAEEVARPLPALPTGEYPAASLPDVDPPRVFADYELLEELGRGGMGVVYKARQRSLGRIVALKMILRGQHASPGDVSRFKAEASAAARLDHPSIVPVYETGEVEGQPYFTMKYIEGSTLSEVLARGPLPAREAASLLAVVARAVQHAHEKGLLHRDLKPSNILLASGGRKSPDSSMPPENEEESGGSRPPLAGMMPFVTDFGLAKRVEAGSSLTNTGAILGTPSYMPPEQAVGSRGTLSAASDVYSLGAILYQMLTGRPPFQAASAVDTLMLVLEQEPLPPRLLNPKADRELEMICLKCLQKPVDLRYQTAAQLADDLDRYLRGEPISARSWSLTYFLTRMLGPTHHADVLENWGLLWMWHSLKLFLLCALTNVLLWQGVTSHVAYLALWSVGLIAWGAIFWALRRRGGPITFVERQIAHIWAAGVAASVGLFIVELLLDLPVLSLSPLLAIFAGMVFLVKAGILSGTFYFSAAAFFLTAVLMSLPPIRPVGLLLFGLVSAACFFFPGLKYYRQRLRSQK